MKKLIILLFCLLYTISMLRAADTIFVRETQVPVLIERMDNVLYYLRLDAKENKVLNEVTLVFGKEVDLSEIQSIKLYYGGTEALQDKNKERFAPVEYISSHTPGKTLAANPSYSIKKAEITGLIGRVVLKADKKQFPGIKFFWISLQMKPEALLDTKITSSVTSVTLDGMKAPLNIVSQQGIEHRMGVGVRHAGDDNSAAYRIPGLVTTNNGTLLAVYDVRYNSSVDLQERVDIGLSRSTDGG